jgi:hypothetical protein
MPEKPKNRSWTILLKRAVSIERWGDSVVQSVLVLGLMQSMVEHRCVEDRFLLWGFFPLFLLLRVFFALNQNF